MLFIFNRTNHSCNCSFLFQNILTPHLMEFEPIFVLHMCFSSFSFPKICSPFKQIYRYSVKHLELANKC